MCGSKSRCGGTVHADQFAGRGDRRAERGEIRRDLPGIADRLEDRDHAIEPDGREEASEIYRDHHVAFGMRHREGTRTPRLAKAVRSRMGRNSIEYATQYLSLDLTQSRFRHLQQSDALPLVESRRSIVLQRERRST
jgi:hypothetical protein